MLQWYFCRFPHYALLLRETDNVKSEEQLLNSKINESVRMLPLTVYFGTPSALFKDRCSTDSVTTNGPLTEDSVRFPSFQCYYISEFNYQYHPMGLELFSVFRLQAQYISLYNVQNLIFFWNIRNIISQKLSLVYSCDHIRKMNISVH